MFLRLLGAGVVLMTLGPAIGGAAASQAEMPGPWLPIAEWGRCAELVRPGFIAELRNAEGQSLFAPCTSEVPKDPFDWASPAIEFRVILEPTPTHSGPLPAPNG